MINIVLVGRPGPLTDRLLVNLSNRRINIVAYDPFLEAISEAAFNLADASILVTDSGLALNLAEISRRAAAHPMLILSNSITILPVSNVTVVTGEMLQGISSWLDLVEASSTGQMHQPGFAGVNLVPGTYDLMIDGFRVALTRQESTILQTLLKDRNCVVARGSLIRALSRAGESSKASLLEKHVSLLRMKLGRAASRIETVRSVGYRLVDDELFRGPTDLQV